MVVALQHLEQHRRRAVDDRRGWTDRGAGRARCRTALRCARTPRPGAIDFSPRLILLHGYGASGAIQETYLKLTPATNAHGMLYVHLDGTLNAQDRRFWNATDACCGYRSGVDDSAYITAVIAEVNARYKVDPRRVFIVGHSNGGFTAYRMACDHADEIAAIVSIEGATWANPSRCKPTQAVATLEVHGTADQTITYSGSTIASARYPGALTTVETWARYDSCDPKADHPATPPHAIVEQLPPATVRSYSTHCDGNRHAELWTQPGGTFRSSARRSRTRSSRSSSRTRSDSRRGRRDQSSPTVTRPSSTKIASRSCSNAASSISPSSRSMLSSP